MQIVTMTVVVEVVVVKVKVVVPFYRKRKPHHLSAVLSAAHTLCPHSITTTNTLSLSFA